MESVMNIVQQDWIHSLGWALLHSLWQHALIALCCGLTLVSLRQENANYRYLVAAGSSVLALFTSTITFYKYQKDNSEIVMRPLATNEPATPFSHSTIGGIVDFINAYLSNITLLWLLGVVIYAIKILFDYNNCQHLKNNNLTATPEKWQIIFDSLAHKIGIKSTIELRISLIAMAPCVIGHLKPVVLLPIKILLGMNQQQIEAILLHELAHIRRQDYLLGIVQTFIKAIFFFNPFLIWISSQIDREREHACDDIAVTINQNPILFANTLKELAEMNYNQKIAMNITHRKHLLQRITRLFDARKNKPSTTTRSTASLSILLTGLLVALCVNATSDNSGKTISLDVTKISAHEVMKEVNKKCGTTEVLAKADNDEVSLKLEDITCKDAIKLLKDFAAGNSEQQ